MYTDSEIDVLKRHILIIKDEVDELNSFDNNRSSRRFTIDGHLLGSVGEIFASYHYGIELERNGTKGYDGIVDNKKVQIKVTQRTGVETRMINDPACKPDYLIVLHLKFEEHDLYVEEVYNGPYDIAISGKVSNSNREYSLSFKWLLERQVEVGEQETINQIKFCQRYGSDD